MNVKELLSSMDRTELSHLHGLALRNLLKYDYLTPDNIARAWLEAIEQYVNSKDRKDPI